MILRFSGLLLPMAVAVATASFVADSPGQQPASAPASMPVRTPDEEAELAIRLADIGLEEQSLAFAQSARSRAPRAALPLLAMGVALDANGQPLAAVAMLKKFNDTPEGRFKDWRGHARLGGLYVRAQKYRLAYDELLLAEPLIPPNDVVARAFFLGDKALAQANMGDRKSLEDARLSVNQMYAILERAPEAKNEPRLWLQCAKAGFALAELNPAYIEQAYTYVMEKAQPLAQAKIDKAAIDDRGPWSIMNDVYALGRYMRGIEFKGLENQEKLYESLSAEAKAQLTQEQRQKRVKRLIRLAELARSLADTDLRIAEVHQRMRLIDSLSLCRKAVDADPKNIESLRLMAATLSEVGDRANAEAHYQRILELAPGDKGAKDALAGFATSAPRAG